MKYNKLNYKLSVWFPRWYQVTERWRPDKTSN